MTIQWAILVRVVLLVTMETQGWVIQMTVCHAPVPDRVPVSRFPAERSSVPSVRSAMVVISVIFVWMVSMATPRAGTEQNNPARDACVMETLTLMLLEIVIGEFC